MIVGSQIRAARALLNWSLVTAAERSGVSKQTIHRMEQREGVPPSRSHTLDRLVDAFQTAGIEFIGDPSDAPGVRLRRTIDRRATIIGAKSE